MSFKLCYVKDCWAYFTSAKLIDQSGDDWDDAPYEHNAGTPYEDKGNMIVKIAFDGQFDQPCDRHHNSPYSVERINKGAIAWLSNEDISIVAGVGIEEFKKLIKKGGGNTYEKSK